MTTNTDKLPSATLRPPDERCGECSAPLVPDQRYCLNCGLRRGSPRVDVLDLPAASGGANARAKKRLSISRGAAAATIVVVALGGILLGTALDGGSSSEPAPKATPAKAKPAPDAEQAAEAAQKKSEDLPDSVVTK